MLIVDHPDAAVLLDDGPCGTLTLVETASEAGDATEADLALPVKASAEVTMDSLAP